MSLDKKIKSKWFYVANILLCIVIVCLINIDSIIKFFGGDFNEKTDIIVIDNTGYVFNEFKEVYNSSLAYIEDIVGTEIVKSVSSLEKEKENLRNNTEDILLVINSDKDNFLKAEVIVESKVDTILFQLINSSLNQVKVNKAMNYYGIDSEKLALIEMPVEISKISLDESEVDEDNELLIGTVFPILILPFFMLTIFLVQMIGAEINEEKSTKSMEIIISNVSPSTHFMSKLLAGNIFVLSQGFLLIVYALFGGIVRFIINKGNFIGDSTIITDVTDVLNTVGIIDNLGIIIILSLLLMVVTFVAYSLLAGILASITTNMEDFQQLQSPIVFISLIGYYLSLMAVMFDGSIFIRIVSYIPFISSLLSPTLLVLGQIGLIDIFISIMLSIVVIFILYKYGLRIYKVGILNYSSNDLWKKMFKAIKN